ncbi:hypothetical protein Lal_00003336 [Lupinus albus]|nr:hypothetical protein Lal_00003336 [Lupinus albus]
MSSFQLESLCVTVAMGRAPCCDKANVKRGPWSPQEDATLRSYIETHAQCVKPELEELPEPSDFFPEFSTVEPEFFRFKVVQLLIWLKLKNVVVSKSGKRSDHPVRSGYHNTAYVTGGNWIALPRKADLRRCGKSCRLRWLNYLRPDIKHGGFTEEEDSIICTLYSQMGSRQAFPNYFNLILYKFLSCCSINVVNLT